MHQVWLVGGMCGIAFYVGDKCTYRTVGQITQALRSGSSQQSCQSKSDGELHVCRCEVDG
jgi:hypothetical protein